MRDSTPRPGDRRLEESEREAGQVLPPPPGHPRFPLLDPMRAIAAISVMLVHVAIFSGGFGPWYKWVLAHLEIGVPFFFLLSGFLLYRPMLAARVSGLPAQRIRDYARNRFFRIFPLFWFILIVTAIVPGMYGAFTGNWWVYFGLLQNLPVYSPDGECVTNPFRCGIPPSWTLGIEVMFYFLLPFFAAGMTMIQNRFRSTPSDGFFSRWVKIEFAALLLFSAISFVIQSSSFNGGVDQWLLFSPIGRAWWFALGMVLAVISVRTAETGRDVALSRWGREHGGWCWLAAIGLYLFGTYVLFSHGPTLAAPVGDLNEYLLQYFFFGVISFFALMPAVFGQIGSGVATRVLAHPVPVRLGLISYGIFLWHYPVLVALNDLDATSWATSAQFPVMAIATFVLTVALSLITYYLLERPLMRWSRSRSKKRA